MLKRSLIVVLVFFSTAVAAQDSAESLVGTWRLVSQESRDSKGGVTYPFGRAPLGLLIYDSAGNVSAQLMTNDLPRFASGDRLRGSADEVRAVVEGSSSYYGRYTVDLSTRCVTHHIIASSFANWNGTDQVRCFEIEGRRLTLTSAPFALGGQTITSVLIWERVN